MANTNLPEEILVEIFCRLPTKSVGRCRCLSTTWRDRLSTSEFAVLHHKMLHQEEASGLILITNRLDEDDANTSMVNTIPFPIQESNTVSGQIQLPTTARYQIAGSCRGLVLFTNYDDESLLLLNPVTMEKVSIPAYSTYDAGENSTFSPFGTRRILSRGLGYDTVTNDYKIVSYGEFIHRFGIRYASRSNMFIDVYSARTGVWKSVPCSLHHKGFDYGAFLNGAIHWLCATSPPSQPVIGAFDLTNEVFGHDIQLPCDDDQLFYHGPFVLCGCLCLMCFKNGDTTHDVWMMKEYGLPESWTKIATIHGMAKQLLCSIGDDKILFLTHERTLVVYNLKEGVSENIVVDGHDQKSIYDGATFVDCLFSPHHQHAGSS